MLKPSVTPSFHCIPIPKQTEPVCPTPTIKRQQQPTTASPFTQGYKKAATALLLHHFACASGTIWDGTLNKMAAYRNLVKHPYPIVRQRWLTLGESKFGCLFQGYGTTEDMDVLNWINCDHVLHNKNVTYPRYTVNIHPEKPEIHPTRITAGGNQLDYHGNAPT